MSLVIEGLFDDKGQLIPGPIVYKGRQFLIEMDDNSDYGIIEIGNPTTFAIITKAEQPKWWTVNLRLPGAGWSLESVEGFAEAVANFAHRTR